MTHSSGSPSPLQLITVLWRSCSVISHSDSVRYINSPSCTLLSLTELVLHPGPTSQHMWSNFRLVVVFPKNEVIMRNDCLLFFFSVDLVSSLTPLRPGCSSVPQSRPAVLIWATRVTLMTGSDGGTSRPLMRPGPERRTRTRTRRSWSSSWRRRKRRRPGCL